MDVVSTALAPLVVTVSQDTPLLQTKRDAEVSYMSIMNCVSPANRRTLKFHLRCAGCVSGMLNSIF